MLNSWKKRSFIHWGTDPPFGWLKVETFTVLFDFWSPLFSLLETQMCHNIHTRQKKTRRTMAIAKWPIRGRAGLLKKTGRLRFCCCGRVFFFKKERNVTYYRWGLLLVEKEDVCYIYSRGPVTASSSSSSITLTHSLTHTQLRTRRRRRATHTRRKKPELDFRLRDLFRGGRWRPRHF